LQREGVFREMKARRAYEKPTERRAREKSEAVRRVRKLARKQAIREGLLPAPKPKPRFDAKGKPIAPRAPRAAGA
jgi:small subunit ribosomal protein S21